MFGSIPKNFRYVPKKNTLGQREGREARGRQGRDEAVLFLHDPSRYGMYGIVNTWFEFSYAFEAAFRCVPAILRRSKLEANRFLGCAARFKRPYTNILFHFEDITIDFRFLQQHKRREINEISPIVTL